MKFMSLMITKYVFIKVSRSLFIEEDEDIILGDSVRLSGLETDGSFYLSGKVNEILGSLKNSSRVCKFY